MRAFVCAYIAVLASASANGLARTYIRDANATLPTRDIYQFPNETFVENLAIRQNGQIIVTVVTTPDLYQVDPFCTNSPAALIHRIPNVTSLLGIVELPKDFFYVIAGNLSILDLQSIAGSYSIWKVDMRASQVLDGHIHPPAVVSKLTDIPEAVFLNGIAVLNKQKNLIVIGDSGAGAVFTLDVISGTYSKTINDPTMKPTDSFPIGINGIKIRDNDLYYTNSGQETFCRIPINSADGTAVGPVKVIVQNFFGDDFSFDQTGNAYVGQNIQNTVAKITPDGVVTLVAGSLNSTLVAGSTSTAFGRTHNDSSILYVTTSGGIGSPVKVEGGKVVAIYT